MPCAAYAVLVCAGQPPEEQDKAVHKRMDGASVELEQNKQRGMGRLVAQACARAVGLRQVVVIVVPYDAAVNADQRAVPILPIEAYPPMGVGIGRYIFNGKDVAARTLRGFMSGINTRRRLLREEIGVRVVVAQRQEGVLLLGGVAFRGAAGCGGDLKPADGIGPFFDADSVVRDRRDRVGKHNTARIESVDTETADRLRAVRDRIDLLLNQRERNGCFAVFGIQRAVPHGEPRIVVVHEKCRNPLIVIRVIEHSAAQDIRRQRDAAQRFRYISVIFAVPLNPLYVAQHVAVRRVFDPVSEAVFDFIGRFFRMYAEHREKNQQSSHRQSCGPFHVHVPPFWVVRRRNCFLTASGHVVPLKGYQRMPIEHYITQSVTIR